jgi:hypothetical protein
MIPPTPNETPAGRLCRELPELDRRELGALLAENHWRTAHPKWAEESHRSAVRTVKIRIEDAGWPWWQR